MINVEFSKEGDSLIATVSGQIDTLTAPELQNRLVSAIEQGENKVVMDVADVNYVSSAGLRVFLIIQKKLKPLGHGLEIRNMRDDVKQVFDVTGFTGLFLFS
ncbi:MAG: STAS domain-containing protein [bacterium]|nr:STAS domain-containing protein [bacterium]